MKKSTTRRILDYLLINKGLFVVAILLAFGSKILDLIGPSLSGAAIDNIIGVGNVNFDMVYKLCLQLLIVYASASILSYLLQYVVLTISKKISYKLREDCFNHLMELPIGYFDSHSTGDIISKISYDVDTVNNSLSQDLVQVFSSVITVVGAFIMMFRISTDLLVVFIITIPLTVLLTKKLTSLTRPMFRKRSGKLGELNGVVEEAVSGHKTIKSYSEEEQMIKKFEAKNEEAVTAYYNADYYSSVVGPSVSFMSNLSLCCVSVLGAIYYMLSRITFGNISSFVLYSRKFSGPINESANIISEFQSAIAAAERLFRLQDELPEKPDDEKAIILNDIYGHVEAKDITFGYSKDKPVLKNVSFSALPGQVIAVVGPTGAGKTTLINLLMRFYDVDKGVISVDSNNIEMVTRKSLRSSYAMVLQDTWLFNGTIYENVAYGNDDATMEDVVRVCKAAKIHRFIESLPQGYDTVLTDEGSNISKGQKQLLTIARAMLLKAQMLILDEATSNVDTRTEIRIQEAMLELMKNKTSFVIAHRLSTIQNADTILVVQDGNIVEQGKHQDLIDAKGFYYQMYTSQFE